MKNKRLFTSIFAFVVALVIGLNSIGPANAATDSDNSTVTFDIQSAIDVTATDTTYDFGNVDPITGTYTQTDVATINVKSNANWSLDATTSTANFDHDATATKPMSDLEVYDEDGTAWNALTTSPTTVPVKDGTLTASTDVEVDYRLTVNWTDETGAYTGTVTYTGTTS